MKRLAAILAAFVVVSCAPTRQARAPVGFPIEAPEFDELHFDSSVVEGSGASADLMARFHWGPFPIVIEADAATETSARACLIVWIFEPVCGETASAPAPITP